MNSLNVKMQKSLFGFSQNAEIEIIHNPRVLKFKGVEIIRWCVKPHLKR